MAEKEERILVLTTHNEDGECECVTQEGCHANDSCAICNVGMTRTEAINRMAKAICRRENLLDSCSHCMFYYKKQNGEMCKEILPKREDDMEPSYIDIAEAALNALLEN